MPRKKQDSPAAEVAPQYVETVGFDMPDSMTSASGSPEPEDAPADRREAAEAEARETIAKIQRRKELALAAMADAKAAADHCDAQIDAVRAALADRFHPLSEAERYRQYTKRSQDERRRRVRDEKAARDVLRLGGKSRLDQAMASRKGWGVKRPTYPQAAK